MTPLTHMTDHELTLAADSGARAKAIQGNRELWDYLEHHPEVPLPNVLAGTHEHLILLGSDAAMIAEVDRIAGELRAAPQWRDGRYTATRAFGGAAVYSAVAFPHTVPAQEVAV